MTETKDQAATNSTAKILSAPLAIVLSKFICLHQSRLLNSLERRGCRDVERMARDYDKLLEFHFQNYSP